MYGPFYAVRTRLDDRVNHRAGVFLELRGVERSLPDRNVYISGLIDFEFDTPGLTSLTARPDLRSPSRFWDWASGRATKHFTEFAHFTHGLGRGNRNIEFTPALLHFLIMSSYPTYSAPAAFAASAAGPLFANTSTRTVCRCREGAERSRGPSGPIVSGPRLVEMPGQLSR